jgi:tRNA1Val (adenine37-N6)-methyltransferase
MAKQRLFRFKNFHIDHTSSAMKVGTDGVLLGAWVNLGNAKNILDIGAGSGVIALMMAQRSVEEAAIDAIEIEEADAEEARSNVANSPWPKKVNVFHSPAQSFQREKKYDVIVSNPPFFFNSYQPPDDKRLRVRHAITLSHAELLEAVTRLMAEDGAFSTILPPTEGQKFMKLALTHGLNCSRQWLFKTRQEKPPERWLLEFRQTTIKTETGEIILYGEKDEWSEPYRRLMKDFYLKA